MGTIDTQEIQLFKETTWGTTGTPTVRLMGITDAQFTPQVPAKVFRQLHGSLGVGNLGARMYTAAEGSLKGIATYEDINYYLENIFGTVTPSGAGPYVRAGVAPLLVSSLNPRLMSLYKGDADGVYSMAGALIDELTLKCEQKAADSEMTFEAKLLGKIIATGALASLSDRAVTPIMASDFALYIDPAASAPGSTLVANTVYSFEWKIKAGRILKQYLGSIGAGGYDNRMFMPDQQTLKIGAELNATSKAYLDSIIGASPWQRNVRLIATQGTNVFRLDMGVQAVGAPPIVGDRDGVKSLDLEAQGLETTGLGNWLKYSVTGSPATLV
jgi:hypothetical protein